MNKAVGILHREHRSISAVLHGLQSLTRIAQNPAVQPDFAVFHAMIRYIDDFPERLHHPKEDSVLFPRIVSRSVDARPLVEDLRAEHVEGAKLIRDLEKALTEFEREWPKGGEKFAAVVDGYSRFHWDHMRKEEDKLLPLAERVLTEDDWRDIDEAFAANDDPIADLREKDMAALFTRIVNIAPDPVGLGDRWGKRAQP